jgi:predicted DNA-binding protein
MNNSKQVMVRIPPELYERLKYVADLRMTTPSAMARLLIKQRIDNWDREWQFAMDQGDDTDNSGLEKLLR